MESTLVLSRKDGSVICTTGRLYHDKRSSIVEPPASTVLSSHSATTDLVLAGSAIGQDSISGTTRVESQDTRVITPVEMLAGSILGFVHSATLLGRAVGVSHNDQGSQDAARAGVFETASNPAGEGQGTSREDHVQLLRMRTRRQEIIIYPDPNYLCCVVQSVGKQANGAK